MHIGDQVDDVAGGRWPRRRIFVEAAGGRPTNTDWSYFNLEWLPSQGVIVAVGWPGQWAADLARDKGLGLRLRAGQELTRFKLLPGEGTYFQCVDISSLAVPERDLPEADFCRWLTQEIGVAAIPLSAFYGNGFDQRVVRFCFAKKDETLNAALDRLARL